MTSSALADVPPTHRKAAETMSRFLKGRMDSIVWHASLKGRPALIALTSERLYVASPGGFGGGVERGMAYTIVTRIGAAGQFATLETSNNESFPLEFVSDAAAQNFVEAATQAQQEGSAQAAERAATAEASGVYPRRATSKVLIVTTNDVPGHEIVAVHGDVFGLTVRARDMFANIGASIRGIVGGEVKGYTTLLSASRNEARERLAAEALAKGANAVVAMRFDCNEIADIMSEVAAYGTAVTIRPIGSAVEA
jgi:uncharacterized protein YbjQ (UPF0145 family)